MNHVYKLYLLGATIVAILLTMHMFGNIYGGF